MKETQVHRRTVEKYRKLSGAFGVSAEQLEGALRIQQHPGSSGGQHGTGGAGYGAWDQPGSWEGEGGVYPRGVGM